MQKQFTGCRQIGHLLPPLLKYRRLSYVLRRSTTRRIYPASGVDSGTGGSDFSPPANKRECALPLAKRLIEQLVGEPASLVLFTLIVFVLHDRRLRSWCALPYVCRQA
jgi:hypothetical protein